MVDMSKNFFTEPEPINHNELKRLLCEVLDEVIDECWNDAAQWPTVDKSVFKKRIFHKIDTAILNGDDS